MRSAEGAFETSSLTAGERGLGSLYAKNIARIFSENGFELRSGQSSSLDEIHRRKFLHVECVIRPKHHVIGASQFHQEPKLLVHEHYGVEIQLVHVLFRG